MLRIVSDEEGVSKEEWKGKWFPKKPGYSDKENVIPHGNENVIPHGNENFNNDQWHGKWFPKKSNDAVSLTHTREGFSETLIADKKTTMGILDPACDDTKVINRIQNNFK